MPFARPCFDGRRRALWHSSLTAAPNRIQLYQEDNSSPLTRQPSQPEIIRLARQPGARATAGHFNFKFIALSFLKDSKLHLWKLYSTFKNSKWLGSTYHWTWTWTYASPGYIDASASAVRAGAVMTLATDCDKAILPLTWTTWLVITYNSTVTVSKVKG